MTRDSRRKVVCRLTRATHDLLLLACCWQCHGDRKAIQVACFDNGNRRETDQPGRDGYNTSLPFLWKYDLVEPRAAVESRSKWRTSHLEASWCMNGGPREYARPLVGSQSHGTS
ncbi:hypothetical protein K431DRAFT_284573 [Polychaeton citri CBS 116435]|uniref:Secreted protein n=1 Tax=Polychaeton citri CBS 116435 TaxID=1314669 RepID=A0A9P4UQA2_9PEZI|nr:hypothetical protein K431DRAFT_284573 [Polychaeton citri CBS 116435]